MNTGARCKSWHMEISLVSVRNKNFCWSKPLECEEVFFSYQCNTNKPIGHITDRWGEDINHLITSDKELKVLTCSPNSPDPKSIEHPLDMPGHPMDGKQTWIGLDSELLTYMNRTSEGVLAGIEALVADPLSPVDCKVGNPWIRLVLVCPGDVQFDKDLGHWRPGRWLGHHVMFLRPFLMWPGALSFWGATTIRGWLIQVMWHPHNMPGPKVFKKMINVIHLMWGVFVFEQERACPELPTKPWKIAPDWKYVNMVQCRVLLELWHRRDATNFPN